MTQSGRRTPGWIFKALGLIALAGLSFWIYDSFLKSTPIDQIERTMESLRRAADIKDTLEFGRYLAVDYHDASGLDRSAVLDRLRLFFLQVDNLSVKYNRIIHENPDLDRSATNTRLIVLIQISGTERGGGTRFRGVLGQGVDVFLIHLRKDDDRWKVAYSERLSQTSLQALTERLRGKNGD